MINFFRKIRKKMADDNKPLKYMRYAIGEILLVVIGILIALSVNNSNIKRVDRIKEIKYLKNIKLDLTKDIANIKFNIEFRKNKLLGTKKLLDQINGAPIDDLTELTYNVINTLYQQRFQPSNITYTELVSSGNMNIISNDSIKLHLLELELLYQANIFGIEHETFEYQEYISKPIFKNLDLQPMKPVFLSEKRAEDVHITKEKFEVLLQNVEFKNGCVISNWTTEEIITIFEDIQNRSKKIIKFIDTELKK